MRPTSKPHISTNTTTNYLGCVSITVITCAALSLVCLVCPYFAYFAKGASVTESHTEEFSLSGVQLPINLIVRNDFGSVDIVGEAGIDKIVVNYSVTSSGYSKSYARRGLDLVNVTISDHLSSRSELSLRVSGIEYDNSFMPLSNDVYVSIRVPMHSNIDLKTAHGGAGIENIVSSGDNTVIASNADIEIINCIFGGGLDITISRRRLELRGVDIHHDFKIKSRNASTDLKNIIAHDGFAIESFNESITFEGTIYRSGDLYSLTASNGNVYVDLSRNVPAVRLKVNVENGTLTHNLILSDDSYVSETRITGYHNSGSTQFPEDPEPIPELVIDTSNGDITITR